jgi:DNA-binding NtrC family response regulator
MNPSPLVFVFESDIRWQKKIAELLNPVYELQTFDQASSLLRAMGNVRQPDLTVLGCSSLTTCMPVVKQVAAASPRTRLLLLSSEDNVEDIAHAMQLGATGFLRKPFRAREFREAILLQLDPEPAASTSAKVQLVASPREENDELQLDHGTTFVRSRASSRELEGCAALVARSDLPVLVLGESGTGKEFLAKLIHFLSDRRHKTFLKVNCAAMPAGLLESELFGYEKGAFTGAVSSNPGKFEICNGGTIFLDEIGEMHPALQAKLLHVLQDGLYSRLGSPVIMKANVRVIAATNIDIKAAIANQKFREDLYYRINGYSFILPPLRERREEIAIFANHFMQKAARRFGRKPLNLSNALLGAFNNYSWPGNLRELESMINRYLILCDEHLIIETLVSEESSLRKSYRSADNASDPGLHQQMRSLKGSAESAAIANALIETRWNRRAAARKMKISYTALRYKIKQYDLERNTNLSVSE